MEGMIDMHGEELNQRLDRLIIKLEKVSILLEEAKVDPNILMELDPGSNNELSVCLSEYDEFLEHLKELTEETVDEMFYLISGESENICCCEGEDDDADIDREEDDIDDEDW
ncbi:hypothetical protein CUJ83_00875 [Methanocella sp. CWC-04]|uniref:Uncharacterized protein n=1 Tax=Methanooceanicella nereidis TaxID=2052831 RepID=A0AAP2W5N4_9EURY|nr:hypothetical protein [Methanocella sp. CWC-04]MCD1293549.1 hypothetical protein [Methanocella sp. CWC-04]